MGVREEVPGSLALPIPPLVKLPEGLGQSKAQGRLKGLEFLLSYAWAELAIATGGVLPEPLFQPTQQVVHVGLRPLSLPGKSGPTAISGAAPCSWTLPPAFRVQGFFEHGSSAIGDLSVGTDSTGSKVRNAPRAAEPRSRSIGAGHVVWPTSTTARRFVYFDSPVSQATKPTGGSQ
jgi:hypothetical protein